MNCRSSECGACCIEISITSSIPEMPEGKPAGVRCLHLNDNNLCNLFGHPDRPKICGGFTPEELFCGSCREEAVNNLRELEILTGG